MTGIHRFYAMTNEDHKKAGHIKDSTGVWYSPSGYRVYYIDDRKSDDK